MLRWRPPPHHVTVEAAARIVGLTPRTLYNAIAAGRLPAVRHDGVTHVDRETLLEAPLLQIGAAARRIGRCRKTLRRWIEAGRLHAHISAGGRRFVALAALRRAAAASPHSPSPGSHHRR
ncbi:MAG: hypothetical protein KatS3mg102_0709 [Planctomycetota bacterium]|nr:MAG: hypothetical protein KatS3mg102_0709 [Planctomycetota bacterium]